MANNCLVTKLKGNVNNMNLPIFDAVMINTLGLTGDTVTQSNCSVIASGVKVKAIQGTFDVMNWNGTETIQSDATEYLADGNHGVYFKNDGIFALIGKSAFGMKTISSLPNITPFITIDCDTINYSTGHISLYAACNCVGTFKPATITNPLGSLVFFHANWDYTGWDAGSTMEYTGLTYGMIKNFSFEPFKSCINLTNLGLEYSTDEDSTPISGNVNELLDHWYNNGKTSGTVQLQLTGTNIKLNGNVVNDRVNINFSAGGWSVS